MLKSQRTGSKQPVIMSNVGEVTPVGVGVEEVQEGVEVKHGRERAQHAVRLAVGQNNPRHTIYHE